MTVLRALRALGNRAVQRTKSAWQGDALALPSDARTLFDFGYSDSRKQWMVATDKDIGGFSEATLDVLSEEGKTFGRFSGNVSLETSGKIVRSGYCMMRSKNLANEGEQKVDRLLGGWKSFGLINLEEYDHVELELRTDGRPYSVNVKTDGGVSNADIYQVFIQTKAGEWTTLQLPLDGFAQSYMGYLKESQMKMNQQRIEHIGLGISDGREGPFCVDLAAVRAVRLEE